MYFDFFLHQVCVVHTDVKKLAIAAAVFCFFCGTPTPGLENLGLLTPESESHKLQTRSINFNELRKTTSSLGDE